jgi:hypothetical protein
MTIDHINRQFANGDGVADDDTGRQAAADKPRPARPADGSRRAHSRHEAQVDYIVATLRPYRVLTRARLADLCGAAHWTEPSFTQALARAVISGRVSPLGDQLYEIADSDPAPMPPVAA